MSGYLKFTSVNIHHWLTFVPIGGPLKQFIYSEFSMPDFKVSPLNDNCNLLIFFFNNPSRLLITKLMIVINHFSFSSNLGLEEGWRNPVKCSSLAPQTPNMPHTPTHLFPRAEVLHILKSNLKRYFIKLLNYFKVFC